MEKHKKESDLWDSKQIWEVYRGDNYKVVDLDNDSAVCLVCFSSNGLYYPNTVEEFEKQVMIRDAYEWENVCCSDRVIRYAHRIVFVRDIFKQWYVSGINETYHSIEGLCKLLEGLTSGYEVVTMGGSSGGYAAVVFGILLNAKKIYSFSGQFTIRDEVKDYFLLTRYQDEETYSKYYELEELLKRNVKTPIFYFYPAGCRQDQEQFQYIEGCGQVYPFAFRYAQHANTMYGCNIPYILVKSEEEMRSLCENHKKKRFSKRKFLYVSTERREFRMEMKRRRKLRRTHLPQ